MVRKKQTLAGKVVRGKIIRALPDNPTPSKREKKEVSLGSCPDSSRKRKRGPAPIQVNSGQDFHRIFSEGLEVTKMPPSIIQLVSVYSLGHHYKKKLEINDIRFKIYYRRLRVEPFWVVSDCRSCSKTVIISEKRPDKLKRTRRLCFDCDFGFGIDF